MKGDINPAQLQRKKEKDRQLKKAKQERLQQRTERLSKRNPYRLQRQISDLESLQTSAGLSAQDSKLLDTLRKDLQDVTNARNKLGVAEREDKPVRSRESYDGERRHPPGKKSMYWDPVLNPKGYPPPGFPYAERKIYEDEEEDSGYTTSDSVKQISLPSGPPPKYQHNVIVATTSQANSGPSKTVYEAAAVIRDLTKESSVLVPAQVRKKQKVETSEPGEDVELQPLEEAPEYYSDEENCEQGYEEIIGVDQNKRKAVMLEEVQDEEL